MSLIKEVKMGPNEPMTIVPASLEDLKQALEAFGYVAVSKENLKLILQNLDLPDEAWKAMVQAGTAVRR